MKSHLKVLAVACSLLGLTGLITAAVFGRVVKDDAITLAPSRSVFNEDAIQPLEIDSNIHIGKAKLGKKLFSDTRLSKNNSVSCQSCHRFELGGADGRQFSVGINNKSVQINSPTVFNSSLNFKQFWDGRADDLSSQIEGPVHNPAEMGTTWDEIVSKLSADPVMASDFKAVFGRKISRELIVESLVEFERALITVNSPFDRYLRGEAALTEAQARGYEKFGSYGCIACHQGQNVGGNMFQTMGVAYNYFAERGGSYPSDLGRYTLTKNESDKHSFKVPSLRNVELTAPYFHDGSEPSLDGAVKKMARYQLGREIPHNDVADIVEFLKSLTGETPAILKPDGYETAKK